MLANYKKCFSILKQNKNVFNLKYVQMKFFRDYRDTDLLYNPDHRNSTHYKSPYQPQFELSQEEKQENDKLPVEERVLDWRKYMKHKGKLKYTTGMYLVDVEPFPRLKIMMLCDIAMNNIKKFPDSFEYKHMIYNYIKYIMKVVDENDSIIDIESKISNVSSAEDIIMMLHNEVSLLQQLLKNRTWEFIDAEKKKIDYKEFFFYTAAFRDFGNPTTGATESARHKKNERPERPATASYDEKVKEHSV
jgi:hypothetical protein